MQDKESDKETKNPARSPREFALKPAGEVVLEHEELPKNKKIHPRRPLPLVPDAPSASKDSAEHRESDEPSPPESDPK